MLKKRSFVIWVVVCVTALGCVFVWQVVTFAKITRPDSVGFGEFLSIRVQILYAAGSLERSDIQILGIEESEDHRELKVWTGLVRDFLDGNGRIYIFQKVNRHWRYNRSGGVWVS